MNNSKIQLSAEEMKLVIDPSWILTKHRVIEKVYRLFGDLSTQMQSYLQQHALLPAEVMQSSPKISKGEQYEAMPYVVLDYPRLFSKENVFAVRSFFWWGNYFTVTLHLKGTFLQHCTRKIKRAIAEKKLSGFYFSYEGNEFSFDLAGKNYFFASETNNFPGNDTALQFLKISFKISFEHWDSAEQKFMQAFEQFIKIAAED